ncbi:MAG: hypothetical protein OEU80_03660 [Deltaproteobacteria bacterium]|nr:hypothetical protein [Deltaproteobacteria bacterium]
MDVLPGVLGSRTLRRTVQVRLGFDFGFWISDLGFLSTVNDIELTVQMSRFVLRFSQAFQQIFIPQSAFRNPHSSTRWHAHLIRARSAQSCTASGIYDKRVPIFTVSRHRFVNYPG